MNHKTLSGFSNIPVPPSQETLDRLAARAHQFNDDYEYNDQDKLEEADRVQAIFEMTGISDVKKRNRSDQVIQERQHDDDRRENIYRRLVQRLARSASSAGSAFVSRTGISSIALSLAAAVFFGATALLVYANHLLVAAGFLLVAGAVEAIDAAAAKGSPVARRDVYIDYMVDRLTDVFLFGTIAVVYLHMAPLIAWLSAATLTCSLLSSYGRAQAEALRFSTHSTFNRFERLVCVFVGLIATAVMHHFNRQPTAVLAIAIGLALVVTLITLFQRFISAIRSRPYSELGMETWDDESFLPRLMEILGSGEGFTVLERTAKDQIPSGGNVVYIDRYKDRTRVRIVKEAM